MLRLLAIASTTFLLGLTLAFAMTLLLAECAHVLVIWIRSASAAIRRALARACVKAWAGRLNFDNGLDFLLILRLPLSRPLLSS